VVGGGKNRLTEVQFVGGGGGVGGGGVGCLDWGVPRKQKVNWTMFFHLSSSGRESYIQRDREAEGGGGGRKEEEMVGVLFTLMAGGHGAGRN